MDAHRDPRDPRETRPPISSRLKAAFNLESRRSSPPIEAQEVYGTTALARIARTLPPVERVYASIRFAIMRPKLLSVLDLLLPAEGRILDVGCGFGLFSAYFAQTQPMRRIVGVDPDPRRIQMARRTCERLGLVDQTFIEGDARSALLELSAPFEGAYVLDVMHHLPREDQLSLLTRMRDLLAPRGILILKDITTEPWFGLKFTELLDRAMVGWNEPLNYRHHNEWRSMLVSLGFTVRAVRVPDILPYPHVVIAATKA